MRTLLRTNTRMDQVDIEGVDEENKSMQDLRGSISTAISQGLESLRGLGSGVNISSLETRADSILQSAETISPAASEGLVAETTRLLTEMANIEGALVALDSATKNVLDAAKITEGSEEAQQVNRFLEAEINSEELKSALRSSDAERMRSKY